MVTLLGVGWTGAACKLMAVTSEATVEPARRSCNTRLATDVYPSAGKKSRVTSMLQLAVPLTTDTSVTLQGGKSTCSNENCAGQ